MRRLWLPASKIALSRKLSVADTVSAVGAPLLAFALRDPPNADYGPLLVYGIVAAALSIVFFRQFRVAHGLATYFSFHDAAQIAKASACAVTAASVILFTLTRLDQIPRSIPPLHFLILTASLIGVRLLRRNAAQREDSSAAAAVSHDQERSVIIVGASRLAWFYIRLLDTFAANNRRVAAILDNDASLHGRSIFGHVIVGGTGEAAALLDDLAQHGIDVTGFVICERERAKVVELFDNLEPLCLERGLKLELLAEQIGVFTDEDGAGREAPPFSLEPAESSGYFQFKRVMEPAIAAVLILALAPLFALAALLVMIGLGAPILFWQRRIGRDGRPIYIYKFKSMRNPIDENGRPLAGAERTTRIGRLLRAAKLDELPQLYNVMRGDMALIGPRPLLPADQPNGRTSRLSVAPGLTGWAQIHGGKLVTAEAKNALDEWYVRNASARLDLLIVFRTIFTVLAGERRSEVRLAAALARAAESQTYEEPAPGSEISPKQRGPAGPPPILGGPRHERGDRVKAQRLGLKSLSRQGSSTAASDGQEARRRGGWPNPASLLR